MASSAPRPGARTRNAASSVPARASPMSRRWMVRRVAVELRVRAAVGRDPHPRGLLAQHAREAERVVHGVAVDVLAGLAAQGGVAVELGMAVGDEVEDALLRELEVGDVGEARVLQAQLVAERALEAEHRAVARQVGADEDRAAAGGRDGHEACPGARRPSGPRGDGDDGRRPAAPRAQNAPRRQPSGRRATHSAQRATSGMAGERSARASSVSPSARPASAKRHSAGRRAAHAQPRTASATPSAPSGSERALPVIS